MDKDPSITLIVKEIGVPAVEPLIARLQQGSESARAEAADLLGGIRDNRAVLPLVSALEDQTWNVRYAAASALGKIKDQRAVAPLIDLLNDEMVNSRAAWALTEITGKDFGKDAYQWNTWWMQNRAGGIGN
jgi:HEAT repeat protein